MGRWRMEYVSILAQRPADGLLTWETISVLLATPPNVSTNAKIVDLGVFTGLMSGFTRHKKATSG